MESNTGPVAGARDSRSQSIKLGLLNTRSVRHKAAVIHDIVRDEKRDIIALMKTWVRGDDPTNAVKLDVAPPGYMSDTNHVTCGGGVAVICRDTLKMSTAFDFSSTEFESLAVSVKTKSMPVLIVCVYRPSGPVTSALCNALADLFDQLLLLTQRFVVCGNFNVPSNDDSSVDPQVDSLLSRYNLVQHVHRPTHKAGNLLDLVITADSDYQSVTGMSSDRR